VKKTSTPLLLALALALLAGCSSLSSTSGTGSAWFAVSVPQALSASISRVSVTASAADFSPLSVELVSSNGVWGGTLGNLPAGPYRSFLAQAFDASGTLLFEGSASSVSIVAEQTSLVALTLQQVNAPPPFQNEAPFIDSLTAPATSVPTGGTLSLTGTAHDPNPGDTLSYAWSATAGSFSSSTSASTSWTAPAAIGMQTLTFTVTDSRGLSSSLFLAVYVLPSGGQGNAQLSISFNTSPQMASLGATASQLAVGQTTSVSASVSDLDGDSLSYSWSATCAGAWSNASSSSAQFTPSALPADTCNNCELTISVSDGRGGRTAGTLALCVSDSPAPQHFPPLILSASGSSLTATPGQVITYEVAAIDPEGSALSFSWAATTGSLSPATTDTSSSRITWTAPSCISEGTTPAVTATITNAFNRSSTQRFSLTAPLPVCGSASAGSMASPRDQHTATLLNNGKVLVTGGSSSTTAEVYDPAVGTWSTVSAMVSPRDNHTATLLLDGKVLVAAGYHGNDTEEVYEPASGTWSPTGSVIATRIHHTATLLLDGKVLITGGHQASPTPPSRSEVYNPASGTWSEVGTMNWPRAFHAATRLPDGKVLVTGGINTETAELYDPASGTWSMAAPMASARFFHTATPLPNGKVLVAGGVSYTGLPGTAELYDPTSGTWSPAGSMISPRYQHTATLLNNGKVLVTGGDGMNDTTATAEVYDPASGTWSTAASLAEPRYQHTATLLNNGKVLITGGRNGSGTLATAELYTP
jgi:hypothetical protein